MRKRNIPVTRAKSRLFFAVHQARKRKLGSDQSAWFAFAETLRETVGRTCGVEDLTDAECRAVIDALRRLPDVPQPGQGSLDMG